MDSARLWMVRLLREKWLLLLMAAGIIAAFLVLRTQGSMVGSVSEVDAFLNSGSPTLVEFYSNA